MPPHNALRRGERQESVEFRARNTRPRNPARLSHQAPPLGAVRCRSLPALPGFAGHKRSCVKGRVGQFMTHDFLQKDGGRIEQKGSDANLAFAIGIHTQRHTHASTHDDPNLVLQPSRPKGMRPFRNQLAPAFFVEGGDLNPRFFLEAHPRFSLHRESLPRRTEDSPRRVCTQSSLSRAASAASPNRFR